MEILEHELESSRKLIAEYQITNEQLSAEITSLKKKSRESQMETSWKASRVMCNLQDVSQVKKVG